MSTDIIADSDNALVLGNLGHNEWPQRDVGPCRSAKHYSINQADIELRVDLLASMRNCITFIVCETHLVAPLLLQ